MCAVVPMIHLSVLVDSANTNPAVSPRPTWPKTVSDPVPESTTPPSDMQQYGALEYSLWKNIGEEFMIKASVNNWIACVPDTGVSFTQWQLGGFLTCRMIRVITSVCTTLPAGSNNFKLMEWNYGPSIVKVGGSFFYYFDMDKSSHWPVRDPCGDNQFTNHLPGEYRGQIWLR